VYAVLGVCCTRCQLMIMPWRDREGWLNFVFCDDGWDVDEKERYGGWRWEQCGGYKRIWLIRGTTYLIGLGRPRVGVITRRIGTRTCHIGDGELTRTRNSLKSQFLMMICPVSSTITKEQEVHSFLSISPCHDQESTWLKEHRMRVGSYDTTRPREFTQLGGSTKSWIERVRWKVEKDRVCMSYNAMMSFYSRVCIAIHSYHGMMSFYSGVCIAIPMQACTKWTHSDVWSQLATTPECLFKRGDQQREKTRQNSDRRAIRNAMRGIDAARSVIRHRGVPERSDGARPLWRSHSARTEMFSADATTSARWERIEYRPIGRCYIRYGHSWHTTRVQTQDSSPRRCQCSHQTYDPGCPFNNRLQDCKQRK